MTKKTKKILFTLLTTTMLSPIVLAEESAYFTTNSGLELTKNEYNYLLEHFDEEYISTFNSDLLKLAMDDINNIEILSEETIYIETITNRLPNGQVIVTENPLTEEEYENYQPIVPLTNCNDGIACWETNAKKLHMIVQNTEDNYQMVTLTNFWKSMPTTRSYDVLAFRWTTSGPNPNYSHFKAFQYGFAVGTTEYGIANQNVKLGTNAIGVSMNLYNNAITITNTLYVYFEIDTNLTLSYYGTYQHATSEVTLAQSQSYNFGAGGLGNVLNYTSSSIRNKYDGMQGISAMVAYVP